VTENVLLMIHKLGLHQDLKGRNVTFDRQVFILFSSVAAESKSQK